MNTRDRPQPATVLTIGGSDSGGAAGIQADLKTWTALAVYGMSVITAVTAQNSLEVTAVHYLSPEFVHAQLDAIFSDYGARGVKTGFIGSENLITIISTSLHQYRPDQIIVDPVLVNHRSSPMFSASVIEAYRNQLLPLASLITPNWAEALLLAGSPLTAEPSYDQICDVVDQLHKLGARQVLITGIRRRRSVVDCYSDGEQQMELPMPWIETANRHGSGDTLSAAICAYLAQAYPMLEAIYRAQKFTAASLHAARLWQLGQGHGPLSHFH